MGFTNCPWRLSPISTFTLIKPKRQSFSCFATAKVGLRTDTRVLDFFPSLSLYIQFNTINTQCPPPPQQLLPFLTSPLTPLTSFPGSRAQNIHFICSPFQHWHGPEDSTSAMCHDPNPLITMPRPHLCARLHYHEKNKIKPTLFLIIITESKSEGKYILAVILALE